MPQVESDFCLEGFLCGLRWHLSQIELETEMHPFASESRKVISFHKNIQDPQYPFGTDADFAVYEGLDVRGKLWAHSHDVPWTTTLLASFSCAGTVS